MFLHNFKYSFKTLLRNKMLLFWTFAFPIIMGIFFNMAFSNIEKSEKLNIIKIAVISNESFDQNEIFKNALQNLSDETQNEQLLHITYTDLKQATEMLKKKQITGYLLFESDQVTLTVNKNGIDETILRYITDEINSNKEMIENLLSIGIEKQLEALKPLDDEQVYRENANMVHSNPVFLKNISNQNLSYTMIEYYTLIAMACLYGGILSMFITNYKLANMSGIGKRTSISPISKGKMLFGSLLASYIVQLLGIALLFVFTIFVLKVDYGTHLFPIILLAAFGSLAGLSLGVAIATLIKTNENTKTGIMIAITMFGCFLSGMMGITMKYIIDKNIPLLNWINPASMITDGFYSLYYYDTFNRFIFDLLSLLVFSLFMMLLSYRVLRRQKYDSI